VTGANSSVKETDAPEEVLRRLVDGDAEALPVVDEELRLLGIVTRRSAIRTLSSAFGRVEA
jgi:CBS domain-containing protein